jgi:hypothetical protein
MIRFALLSCASPSDHVYAVLCRLQCSSGSAFWYLSSNCASSEPSGTRCSVFFSASCFSSSYSLLLVASASFPSLSLLSSCSIASCRSHLLVQRLQYSRTCFHDLHNLDLIGSLLDTCVHFFELVRRVEPLLKILFYKLLRSDG